MLAGKLWGAFAIGFWAMIALMAAALWVLLVPGLLSRLPVLERATQPQFTLASAGGALVTAYLLFSPSVSWLPPLSANVALVEPLARTGGWALLIIFAMGVGLGFTPWLKTRKVTATVIAAIFVLIGMWLERWNIIVPTMTRPRLIAFADYLPTFTEISLTAASVSLFILFFLLFFKLFPAISLWEIAEGRVIEEAHAQISVPEPEPTERRRGLLWTPRR